MEEWKDIKDYEGYYQISSYGQVKIKIVNRLKAKRLSKTLYKRKTYIKK